MINTKEYGAGTLRLTWEGPYKVTKVLRFGIYRLDELNGKC